MSEAIQSKAPRIIAAIAKVMAEVGVVGKTKKNQAQGYQFRGVDDVVAEVQAVMAANGVIVVPKVVEREREVLTTQKGGSMASVRLLVDHHFMCAEDGSSVVTTTLGEAMDSGDKASNKAMSAALKYALVETFMIPTREADRDTEEHSPVMGPPPATRAAPPSSPPSNVRNITGAPSNWEVRINEAATPEALALVASALHREPMPVREAHRAVYNRRMTELAARVK